MLLDVSDLYVGYQKGIDILRGFSLKVDNDSIVGVIGPNGAGKSTLLKTIYGFLEVRQGDVLFESKSVVNKDTCELVKLGMSYVPQLRGFFPQLSVDDNLIMSLWSIRKDKHEVQKRLESIYEDFPTLQKKKKDKASSMSGGEAKMLELAKGLIVQPKIMLIDEPSAGLAPMIAEQVYESVSELPEKGISVLLVDQNVKKAVEVADYTYLMQLGRNAAEGTKEVFSENLEEILSSSLLGSNVECAQNEDEPDNAS